MTPLHSAKNNRNPVGEAPATGDGVGDRMSAKTLPPATLTQRAQFHLDCLAAEQPPRNYLESLLHAQLARDAAGLDIAFELESALIDGNNEGPNRHQSEARKIQAIRAPALSDLQKYKAKHERGLYAATRQLIRLDTCSPDVAIPAMPLNEQNCIAHLVAWVKNQTWTCPACGSSRRYWLAARLFFECQCGRQLSYRAGTVFEQSHLPLTTWFTVIAFAVCDPRMNAGQIVRVTGGRLGTIRSALKQVRAALASPDGDRLLAGAPQFVLATLYQVTREDGQMLLEHERKENTKPMT